MAVCTAARSSSACGSFLLPETGLLPEKGIRLEAVGFAGGGFIAYRAGAEGGAEAGTSTLMGNAPVDVPPGPVAVKVYAVPPSGRTTAVPVVPTNPIPGSTRTSEAPRTVQRSAVVWPSRNLLESAVKLTIVGRFG